MSHAPSIHLVLNSACTCSIEFKKMGIYYRTGHKAIGMGIGRLKGFDVAIGSAQTISMPSIMA